MRFILKVSVPTDKDGSLGRNIQAILEEQKPEAADFTEIEGLRTGFIVVNIEDPAQIPAMAEPWFLAFNAKVEFHPAMTAEDLGKAGPGIELAVSKYGGS